jgi:hypothetical protein
MRLVVFINHINYGGPDQQYPIRGLEGGTLRPPFLFFTCDNSWSTHINGTDCWAYHANNHQMSFKILELDSEQNEEIFKNVTSSEK